METEDLKLPNKLEKLLAILARRYSKERKTLLARLLVNSGYSVSIGYEYDNWDGGQWGHAIHFQVPSVIYEDMLDNLKEMSDQLKADINKIDQTPQEYIAAVFFDVRVDSQLTGWREKSGLMVSTSQLSITRDDADNARLWGVEALRIFLSHKAEFKQEATALKIALKQFGASAFVAHEDIEPSREWQDEIEKALSTMHVLVALMSGKFHQSIWTDQEIGIAIGRNVPIISVRLGCDPYGFIGKYQAVSGQGKSADVLAGEIFNLLLGQDRLEELCARALVASLEKASSFKQANILMGRLNRLKAADSGLIERLQKAPTLNDQVEAAYKVRQDLPSLIQRLKQLRKRQ